MHSSSLRAPLFVSFLLLNAFGLAAKREHGRRTEYFLVMLGLALYLTFFALTGDPAKDYFFTVALWTRVFTAVDYLVLTDAHKEFKRVGQARPIQMEPLIERLKWALNLLATARGINWMHEPRQPTIRPHPPPMSRKKFILNQLFWTAIRYSIYDIANALQRDHPAFRVGSEPIPAYGWKLRFWAVPLYLTTASLGINLQYGIGSIICVALGLYKPEDWPPLWGYWTDAFTIRRFWGRVWHQYMRRFLLTHARWVTNLLGIKRGTNASAYTQLFVSFFISGVIHWIAEYALLGNWGGGGLIWFPLQAAGIMFEDFIIFLGKKAGISGDRLWVRLVGYLWVLSFHALALHIWADPMLKGGINKGNFSVTMGLLKGEWVAA